MRTRLLRTRPWDISRFALSLALALAVALAAGCMKSDEEKFADYMESGRQYLEEREFSSAVIEFKNAARVQADNPEAFYQLAVALLRNGETQEAVNAAQQAVFLDREHMEANLLLAQLMVQIGEPDVLPRAEELLNNVLSQSADNSDALFVLAATRARLGNSEDAERLLREALQTTPEHLRSSINLARIEMQKGNLEEAENILKRARDQAENKRQAGVALGQFYISSQQPERARETFEAILREDPDYGPALLGLGALHLRSGDQEKAEEVYKRASGLEDERYKTLYGQVLIDNGKFEEGIAEFRRLLEAEPSSRELRARLISAYVRHDQLAEAEGLLNEAVAAAPEDADARLQRAQLYLQSGQMAKAREDLSKVLEYRPNSFQAHFLLARVHEAAGDERLVRQELDEALRINPEFLPARAAMAKVLLRGARPQSALDILNEAPESQRNSDAVVVAKIWALLALDNHARAREMIDSAMADRADPPADLYLQDGALKLNQDDYAGARASFEQALEKQPGDLRSVNLLAGTYLRENKMALALEAVRKQAEAYPNRADLQMLLADWYKRAGYGPETKEAYEAAVAAGDPSNRAAIELARIAASEGRLDDAVGRLDSIIESSSRNVAAKLLKGTLLDKAGRRQEAIQAYRGVVELRPENVIALNNLAYLLAVEGQDLDQALNFAQQAKEYNPENGLVDDTLGWVFYLRGVYDTAVIHLQSAARRNPDNAAVQFHLAMAQAKAGNLEAGRKAYEAGMQLNANAPEAAQARSVLEDMN